MKKITIFLSFIIVIFITQVFCTETTRNGAYWATNIKFSKIWDLKENENIIDLFKVLNIIQPIELKKTSILYMEGTFPGFEVRGLVGQRPFKFSLEVNNKKLKEVELESDDFSGDFFTKKVTFLDLKEEEKVNSFQIKLLDGSAVISEIIFLQ